MAERGEEPKAKDLSNTIKDNEFGGEVTWSGNMASLNNEIWTHIYLQCYFLITLPVSHRKLSYRVNTEQPFDKPKQMCMG